jgi:CRP/FNR family transcriptional regulator, cyclic AMP receptor protein
MAIQPAAAPSGLRRHGQYCSPPENVTIATQFHTKKQGGGTWEFANFRWNESKFRAKFKQPPRVAARLPVTEFVLPPANWAINDDPKESLMGKPAKCAFDAQVFLAKVGEGKSILQFKKDQNVFVQGAPADTVFYIQKGRIKLTVLSDHGKEAVVGIIEAGQFFGEGCMNGHKLRISTTTAMENCVITAITKTAMIATLHNEPQFSEMFMAYLLTRNSRIEEDLIDQLFNSSERRLARLLLLLANFGKEGSPQPIGLSISQETLAEMIGTTRSRVSFFMNKFRKLGLIDYNGHIEVHTSLLSAVLHDKPQLQLDESGP